MSMSKLSSVSRKKSSVVDKPSASREVIFVYSGFPYVVLQGRGVTRLWFGVDRKSACSAGAGS